MNEGCCHISDSINNLARQQRIRPLHEINKEYILAILTRDRIRASNANPDLIEAYAQQFEDLKNEWIMYVSINERLFPQIMNSAFSTDISTSDQNAENTML